MFKLSQKETYKWKVIVSVPDNNAFREQSFVAEFKIIPQSQIDLIAKNQQNEDIDLAGEVLVGWEGIEDEGAPLLFSEEAKTKLLDIPYVKMAVIRAFFSSIAGRLPKN